MSEKEGHDRSWDPAPTEAPDGSLGENEVVGAEGFVGGGDGKAMEKVIQLSESIANLSESMANLSDLAIASDSVAASLRLELDSKMNEARMILADCVEIDLPLGFDDFSTLKLIRELGFQGKFLSHNGDELAGF